MWAYSYANASAESFGYFVHVAIVLKTIRKKSQCHAK